MLNWGPRWLKRKRVRALIVCSALAALLIPTLVSAHIERPSYWPLPGADCSVHPCAGGNVPSARSLFTALAAHQVGVTRVVCQGAVPSPRATRAGARALSNARHRHLSRARIVALERKLVAARRAYAAALLRNSSVLRLRRSIAAARIHGYKLRPSQAALKLSRRQAVRLLRLNERLLTHCRFHEIQPAVTASHNNGRVVIMPGLYTEPGSRARPTNDPSCSTYKITDNSGGDISGAVSYSYQLHCPNDQNLIAVMGRALGPGQDPHPPNVDRHGIPNRGTCVRCNLQLEGSGVSADDVVIDAGRVASGNGPPNGSVKDVGIRADRADGFVLRNVTVRHAREHDVYVLETNGYLLDRFKVYWAGEYGVLTFVEDHGLIQNCDAVGSGDSGLYPGAGGKTSAGRDTRFYPTFRYSQEIRFCDSHHNLAGYSGTDGSGTHIDHNNFYDNSLGFTTDVFTAPGHPGFPQQGDLIEYNNFYSNNFNPYLASSDIAPSEPEPVGTGLWIAGGNDDVVRYNHFYDNWRRGTMLFAVPDSTVCGPPPVGSKIPVPGCNPAKFSTSYRNSFYGNVMGVSPAGVVLPNGTDFWWDSFPTNTGNCWYRNTGASRAGVTSSPSNLPNCGDGAHPSTSIGTGDSANESELSSCFGAITAGGGYNPATCPWFSTPPKPARPAGATERSVPTAASRTGSASPRHAAVCELYRHEWTAACAGR